MAIGQYSSNVPGRLPKPPRNGRYGLVGSQPGSVRPRMTKLYDGRNVATRPIPVITDYGDILALHAAAADQRPKGYAVNMPSGPRPAGAAPVFGTRVAGGAKIRGGVFNPATGLGEHT
jgi:hypothetical protein